jgi:hypothetical protein
MCHDLNLCCPNSLTASSPLHTAVFRVESNDLTGAVPDVICIEFDITVPAFVADCIDEIACSCCMFCCEDVGMCQCQFESIELVALCSEYSLSTNFTGI